MSPRRRISVHSSFRTNAASGERGAQVRSHLFGEAEQMLDHRGVRRRYVHLLPQVALKVEQREPYLADPGQVVRING